MMKHYYISVTFGIVIAVMFSTGYYYYHELKRENYRLRGEIARRMIAEDIKSKGTIQFDTLQKMREFRLEDNKKTP